MKIFKIFLILILCIIITNITMIDIDATLLPKLDETEPWEENINYYINKYPIQKTQKQTIIITTSSNVESENEQYNYNDTLVYYGCCWITHYCPCSRCCGKSDGITASGTYATAGWTVACGGLPFGTLVQINGHTYCIEDRGVGAMAFDIFVNDHQYALELGAYWADVWIIK